jgi:hypothetical protein
VLGHDHPDTLLSYHNLGTVYIDVKRWAEAERVLRTAASGRARVLGEAHPDAIFSTINLAWMYRANKRFEDAERELLRVAPLVGLGQGPDTAPEGTSLHPGRARVATEFAGLYSAWGRPQQAAEWTARVPPKK